MAKPRPLLFLDIDGVILSEPNREYDLTDGLLVPTGKLTPPETLEAGLVDAWGDADGFTAPGANKPRLYSPKAVAALADLVAEAGLRVIYHTTWLAWPEHLTHLIDSLGLPKGEFLEPDPLALARDWFRAKPYAIADRLHRAHRGAKVVIIDDHSGSWRLRPGAPRSLIIRPEQEVGIEPMDIADIRVYLGLPERT